MATSKASWHMYLVCSTLCIMDIAMDVHNAHTHTHMHTRTHVQSLGSVAMTEMSGWQVETRCTRDEWNTASTMSLGQSAMMAFGMTSMHRWSVISSDTHLMRMVSDMHNWCVCVCVCVLL